MHRILRFVLGGALGLFVTGSLASCSLVVDRSTDQCSTDGDCKAFAGTTCQAGVCAKAPACTTNAACKAEHGDYWVCNHASGACAPLLSEECTAVSAGYEDDGALIIGSVEPVVEEDADPEANVEGSTGKILERATQLAIVDFNKGAQGLPPTSSGLKTRPIVLVTCDDHGVGSVAAKIANHLADAGVPAIIGSAYSGVTSEMATGATIGRDMLVISPSATAISLTNLLDNGLVWRTSPSDVYQAEAIVKYSAKIEEDGRAGATPEYTDDIRYVTLHKSDSYGQDLAIAVEKKLIINGKPATDSANKSNYNRFNYGDPADTATGTKYPEAVAAALSPPANIILLIGTSETSVPILRDIEAGWPVGVAKPRYLITDGGIVTALWDTVVGTNDDLRKRIRGTVPGTDNPVFGSFASSFRATYSPPSSPDVFGAAGAYDAVYLVAYAAVAVGDEAITGSSLAGAMSKLVGGDASEVGGSNITKAFSILQQGGSIDFIGASGALDFDLSTGEAPSDIQVWCMPKNGASAAQSSTFSGLYYNANAKALSGAEGTICN